MDWANLLNSLMTNLVVTAFAYLLIPTIIAFSRKKYSDKKLKTITAVNCILVWIFFRMLQLALGVEPSSGIAVFLWGGIGYWILIEHNLKTEPPSHMSTSQPNMHTSLSNRDEFPGAASKPSAQNAESVSIHPITSIVMQKVKYCSRCGNAIDPATKKCTGCGKQYFKGFRLSTILLALVLSISIIGNCHFYSTNTALQSKLSNLNQLYDDLMLENINLSNSVLTLKEEKFKLQNQSYSDSAKIRFYDNHIVFVIDSDKKYYHHYDCVLFQSCKTYSAYEIKSVRNKKYTPCFLCCD